MADFVPELTALSQILLERKGYRETLFKVTMEEKLSQVGKKRFIENVNGVLRHYFCLSFECQNLLLDKVDSLEHLLALVALYVLRYRKESTVKEVYQEYHDAFLKLRLMGDPKSSFESLSKSDKEDFVLPEELKKSPYLYNSLILEFPEFLLRRVAKDFTNQRAISVAANSHKRPNRFYAMVEKKDTPVLPETVLQPIVMENHEYLYKTNKPIPKEQMKQSNLYPIGYVEALAYSKLSLPPLQPKILLVGAEDGFDILPIAQRVEKYYQSQLVCCLEKDLPYRSGVDILRHFQLKKTRMIHTKDELIKTFVEYDYFDTVILYSKDLHMGLSRLDPSILPSLKEKDIQKSYENQLKNLLEQSKFVKEGGSLLFVNHGFVKKETYDVIEGFLAVKKDFILMDNEIVFFDRMDSSAGYYALLKRKEKKHD
jgi:hypothetical protein